MVDQETDIHLNIGTRYELGHSLVLPTVEKLHIEHPNWKIHLVFGDSRSLMSDLRKGEIDAVIGSMRLTMSDLEYMPLHEEEYRFVGTKELCCASCAHPRSRRCFGSSKSACSRCRISACR